MSLSDSGGAPVAAPGAAPSCAARSLAVCWLRAHHTAFLPSPCCSPGCRCRASHQRGQRGRRRDVQQASGRALPQRASRPPAQPLLDGRPAQVGDCCRTMLWGRPAVSAGCLLLLALFECNSELTGCLHMHPSNRNGMALQKSLLRKLRGCSSSSLAQQLQECVDAMAPLPLSARGGISSAGLTAQLAALTSQRVGAASQSHPRPCSLRLTCLPHRALQARRQLAHAGSGGCGCPAGSRAAPGCGSWRRGLRRRHQPHARAPGCLPGQRQGAAAAAGGRAADSARCGRAGRDTAARGGQRRLSGSCARPAGSRARGCERRRHGRPAASSCGGGRRAHRGRADAAAGA